MEIYEKVIQVSKDDLDFLDHVNNVRYIQWIQDISEEHWQEKAPPELKEQVVWVVLNHNVDYRNPARLGDRIHIKTFVKESSGATSIRAVEMYNESTNTPLVSSKTKWCLLNAKTQKPMRISELIREVFEAKG
ncbi:MAG: thioesterase family protein [Bacteroidota bacterium]